MKHEIFTVSNYESGGLLADYLKELNEDEYQSLVREAIYIEYYESALHGMNILNENTSDLKTLMYGIIANDEYRTTMHNPITYDQIEASLNTKFFNVLSSFYHFTNYMEFSFVEWFGKQSPETKFIEDKLSEYFDKYFEYRFFYKLRNYVTHCGIPINFIFDGNNEKGSFLYAKLVFHRRIAKEL